MPKCGAHHKLSCKERFQLFFDKGEYQVLKTPLPKDDPLNFVDSKKYTDRLKEARSKTKQDDAILISKGKVNQIDVIVGAQDFRFMGGSFGAASGEAFIAGAQHAIESKAPFIFFSCSGGQKMQESCIALAQMTRTTLAVNELKRKNIPFIVVLTNPTTGGVTASWAMLGDVIISEPSAMVAFAGARVIKDTVRENLPENFQTAEFTKDHGFIDLIVERRHLNSSIGKLLNVLLKKQETQVKNNPTNVSVKRNLQSAS